jgi:hypothetical protein
VAHTANNGTTVDLDGLRGLYRDDSAAKDVLDHLARRKNNQGETPVNRLATLVGDSGSAASIGDVRRVLKALEALGCGKYIPGRKGHQSRFQWGTTAMTSVGRYASGQADVIEKVNSADVVEDEAESLAADSDATNEPTQITHEFRLRPDHTVSLKLPADLTSTETERLAGFIKTLPFGE